MYNLIMANDDSSWDLAEGEAKGAAEFHISRLFEYTDPEVRDQHTPISESTLTFLAQLPTLLMSERQLNRREDGFHEYVTVKLGTVSNLKISGSNIEYDFEILRDFGEISLEDKDHFEETLGLGKWELNRTHWAVKQQELFKCLEALKLDLSGLPSPDEPELQNDTTHDAVIVETLEDFVATVLGLETQNDEEIFFRGHSDASYRLEPSLMRRDKKGDFRYLQNENKLCLELLTAHPQEFSGDQYTVDKLVRMQHFGLPTRLLDVTTNPLVALFFCCTGVKFKAECKNKGDGEVESEDEVLDKSESNGTNAGEEIDGEVVILRSKKEDIKFYDSDTVSCLANLALMDFGLKEKLDSGLNLEEFNKTDECKKLVHHIRGEKPYFKEEIRPEDIDRTLLVKGRISNERISSQSGAFILFGNNAVLPDTGHGSLKIERIVVRNKVRILEQLDRLNIRSSTIYPGIEKSAEEIARKYESVAPDA